MENSKCVYSIDVAFFFFISTDNQSAYFPISREAWCIDRKLRFFPVMELVRVMEVALMLFRVYIIL